MLLTRLCWCRAWSEIESFILSTKCSLRNYSTEIRYRKICRLEIRESSHRCPLSSGLNRSVSSVLPPSNEDVVAADAGVSKLPVNQVMLKNAWEPVDRAKPDDWREWMKRLSVQLLKSSPSLSLRACANLAEVYHPLARDLFNAAFVSCWTELYDQYQVRLTFLVSIILD